MEAITQQTSDGYHTFEELYNHRMILFATVTRLTSLKCWKSKLHEDGTMFDDYFIVGINDKQGEIITYHYHLDNWNSFDHCKTLVNAPKYDGHTSVDVLSRISKLNK